VAVLLLQPRGPGAQLCPDARLRRRVALDDDCRRVVGEAQLGPKPALLVALKVARDGEAVHVQVLQQGGRLDGRGAQPEDAEPGAHRFFFSYFAGSGSPIVARSCSTMSSLVFPSAWAWKLVLTRWRSTGTAAFLMSSIATLNRPSIAANAFAPQIRN